MKILLSPKWSMKLLNMQLILIYVPRNQIKKKLELFTVALHIFPMYKTGIWTLQSSFPEKQYLSRETMKNPYFTNSNTDCIFPWMLYFFWRSLEDLPFIYFSFSLTDFKSCCLKFISNRHTTERLLPANKQTEI